MPDPLCHTAAGIAKLRVKARDVEVTTKLMASFCAVDMNLWNRHSNGCLDLAKELPAALDEIERLRKVLAGLVNLKEHKDAHGKDAAYLAHQPVAWTAAKGALRR